ncbi:MAG: NmrA/HSCARG family protein [Xanthomonadales bacterium]|nr:NmrA/HSCARG family protein [Xanthomonadales bacterium]
MSERKIIAVVGATGAQGGGLARAILDHPDAGFGVRALTRKAGSDKARQLQQQGADVVEADLDDRASLEAAFEGAYAAYCVTNFWEHFSPEKELQQAGNLAAAAAAARLRHVIWSTLEDTRRWVPLDDDRMPTLMENYKVPHFDAKGEADRFFIDAGVPATFLLTSFYWDNLIYFGSGPTRAPDGMLHLTLPMGDARLPGIAAADIGRCALGIFRDPERFRGETVGIAGEHLTGGEMAQALSLALDEAVLYNAISPAEYRALGFPGAADLGNMFQFKRDFNDYFCGARSVEFTRELNPDLQTFDGWLANHAGEIPLE